MDRTAAAKVAGASLGVSAARRRVALAGEIEEIDALGRRELQGFGEAREGRRRDGDLAPLLDPGVPGDAEARELGDLLASEAGRAPARAACKAEGGGVEAGAVGLKEIAQGAPPVDRRQAHHGSIYTRIKAYLVPV
ncbi:MAG TPA: hypothetical protein VGH25_11630 [Dongiaceae bacterium]